MGSAFGRSDAFVNGTRTLREDRRSVDLDHSSTVPFLVFDTAIPTFADDLSGDGAAVPPFVNGTMTGGAKRGAPSDRDSQFHTYMAFEIPRK